MLFTITFLFHLPLVIIIIIIMIIIIIIVIFKFIVVIIIWKVIIIIFIIIVIIIRVFRFIVFNKVAISIEKIRRFLNESLIRHHFMDIFKTHVGERHLLRLLRVVGDGQDGRRVTDVRYHDVFVPGRAIPMPHDEFLHLGHPVQLSPGAALDVSRYFHGIGDDCDDRKRKDREGAD